MWENQNPRFKGKCLVIQPWQKWRWDRIGSVGVILCGLVLAVVGLWYG